MGTKGMTPLMHSVGLYRYNFPSTLYAIFMPSLGRQAKVVSKEGLLRDVCVFPFSPLLEFLFGSHIKERNCLSKSHLVL